MAPHDSATGRGSEGSEGDWSPRPHDHLVEPFLAGLPGDPDEEPAGETREDAGALGRLVRGVRRVFRRE